MGNCMRLASSRAAGPKTPKRNPDHSKATTRTDSSWNNSTQTSSTNPSSFTVSSYYSENLPTPRNERDILSSSNLKAFTFNELKKATGNFKVENLIGEGGFGYVYKGWVDEQSLTPVKPGSGMVVAVKKLKPEGFQGHQEWLTEVLYLGQLHHRNLVKLIGYCSEGEHRLLVYECLVKGSLENHLFRRNIQPLPWSTRIKIAVGAARGLAFLHNAKEQVIYRDFKPSNILLDTDFDPRLSDFGLAKAGPTGDRTHVSTRVMGTQGYAAPEYVATGRLSAKADVYSFGVVLLELLSGRPALDKSKSNAEQKLVEWAKPYLDDRRTWMRIMDPKLEGQYPKKGAQEVAGLALQCVGTDGKLRPSMTEVLARLESVQGSSEMGKSSQAKQWNSPNRHSPRSPLRQRPPPRNLPLPRGSPLSIRN